MFSGFDASPLRKVQRRLSKSLSRATEILTGIGPSPAKQLKNAILEGDEEKAINIYTTNNEKNLKSQEVVHPSKPFPSKKNQISETPLHLSAYYALINLLKLLIDSGGDPNVLNSRNETCIHCVCKKEDQSDIRFSILEILTNFKDEKGEKVSINQVDIEGNTAIHYASSSGLVKCVELLVSLGAIISIVNKNNLTCCECAEEKGHKQLASMLELALVFQPEDNLLEEFGGFQSLAYESQPEKLFLSGDSMTLNGVEEFANSAIAIVASFLYDLKNKSSSESKNNSLELFESDSETQQCFKSRAEVLLALFSWNHGKLLKEYVANETKILSNARLEPLSVNCFRQTIDSNNDFNVDETEIKDADDKDDNEGNEIDLNEIEISDFSDVKSKAAFLDDATTSDVPCLICGDLMLLPVNIEHYLSKEVVQPERRELKCNSGHSFCVGCWSSNAKIQVNDNGLGVLPCPGFKCGEILTPSWAPIVLDDEISLSRFSTNRQRNIVDCGGFKNCPHEGCDLVIHFNTETEDCQSINNFKIDESESPNKISPPNEKNPQSSLCANGHAFCLSCTMSAHSPCSCKYYSVWINTVQEELGIANLKSEDGTNQEDVANALWVAANTKRCPRCNTAIEKDEGCNHMSCRKCRKEFCWICMQDWSLHSENTGGYFQCNRFMEKSNDGAVDLLAEEKGNAHAETLRLRDRGAKMAKFIHHYTRYQAHGDSFKMEAKMYKETINRIYHGLIESKQGNLIWLQKESVLNPLEESSSTKADSNSHIKSSEQSFDPKFTNPQVIPVHSLKETSLSEDLHLHINVVKTNKYLEFLDSGFQELLKCRNFLQWSYPYSYLEFDEYDSTVGFWRNQYNRMRTSERKMTFELLQADLEATVETLSDVVARRRLRATQNQIILATRSARSKRIEFESFIVAMRKRHQEKGSRNSTPGRKSSQSSPFKARLLSTIRTGGSRNVRGSPSIQRSDSEESIDLATLLFEMEMAARAQRQAEELHQSSTLHNEANESNEPLNSQNINDNDEIIEGENAANESASCSSSNENSIDSSHERRRYRNQFDNDLNTSVINHNRSALSQLQSQIQRMLGTGSRSNSDEGFANAQNNDYAARDSFDDLLEGSSINNLLLQRDEQRQNQDRDQTPVPTRGRRQNVSNDRSSRISEDSNESFGEQTPTRVSNRRSQTRQSRNGRQSSSNRSEVPDDPRSARRIARLTRRAEEEAALNHAILMSIRDNQHDNSEIREPSESDIEALIAMGFTREQSIQSLKESRNNLELAVNQLLGIDF